MSIIINAVEANQQPEHRVKSAIIFRILEHINWPQQQELQQFDLAFISDDQILFDELTLAANTLKVHGLPLNISKQTIENTDADKFEVIYIKSSNEDALSDLANKTRRTNTLILSDQSTDKNNIMVNFKQVVDRSLRFEVNRSNMVFERLTIDPDLLLLGGTEIDVAELFRENETKLLEVKQELFDKQQQLNETHLALIKEQGQIKEQQQHLSNQQQTITEQHTQIRRFKSDLRVQQQQLAQRSIELEQLNQEVAGASEQLKLKQTELLEQEKSNAQQLKSLKDQAVKVAYLNEQIYEKQAFLAAQEDQLKALQAQFSQQAGIVLSQKRVLQIGLLMLIALVAIALYSWRLNLSRKRSNNLLHQAQANLVTMSGIGRDLTTNLDFDAVLEQVYQSLNKVLDIKLFQLGVVNEAQNIIEVPLIVHYGQHQPARNYSLNDDNVAASYCVQHQKELLADNVEQWQQLYGELNSISAVKLTEIMATKIYLPLIIETRVIGFMTIQTSKANGYSDQQIGMIRSLSRYIAIAVENAVGFDQLQQQKHMIESKNKQLLRTQQQLLQSEKMASLGMVTSNVVEQLSQPNQQGLASTQQLDQMLSQLETSDLTTTIQHQLKQINELNKQALQYNQQLAATIQYIHSFEHQDDEVQRQVPLAEQLTTTINMVNSQYRQVNINIDPPLLQEQTQYPEKLTQAFMNLLVNACQACEDTQQPSDVSISGHKNEHSQTISIKDNGIGISEEQKKHILQPFYSSKEGESGVGLNLSLDIITDLGGQLTIDSELNQGTTISVSIPLPLRMGSAAEYGIG